MHNAAEEVIALAERKSKKVQLFASLLRDPDLAEYVALLTGGANGASGRPAVQSPPIAAAEGVREAIRALYPMLPERFTSADVFEMLETQGFRFNSKDAMSSIRDQLYALCKPKINELKVVKEGKGGKPNVYKRVKTDDSGLRQPRPDLIGEPT